MFCTNNNIDVNNNIEDIELTKQWSLPNPDVMVKLLKRKNLFDPPFWTRKLCSQRVMLLAVINKLHRIIGRRSC